MLMTRDNPSIATKVNTMTSSVIILLLGNARLRCLCHRSVRQERIMDSGAAELCSVRTCPVCIEDYFQSIFEVLRVGAIFSEPKSEDHKVTGSKPVLFRMFFFSSTSQFLGSSARNLRRLSCGANVKLLR